MSARELRGKVAIVGVGLAGLGEAPGFSDIELLAQAAKTAVEDAGLNLRDIDGLCTASLDAAMWPLNVCEYLRIRPTFVEGTSIGGSAYVHHILPSVMALHTGICDAVLVCYGSNQRTSTFKRSERIKARDLLDPYPYEAPYSPFNPPTAYALAAARHMHQYGTTRRHLAEVAVAARKWAQLNPEAFARDPLTIDDVLAMPILFDPFSVRDCCLVTDGAAAYVLVRADRAKGMPKKPIYVLGTATAVWHRQVSSADDVTVSPSHESGARAFAMADLGPKDMHMLQTYDAFTINTIWALEDLGFCAKGEGGRFVENGAIAPGGRFPVNTNGGGLSCVHPGMYGAFAVIEAVRQLRGECGDRQLREPQTAAVNGNGGHAGSSQSTAILGTADVL